MFVLKILTLKNAVLALPILAFTSASDPPCLSTMLPSSIRPAISLKQEGEQQRQQHQHQQES
uniref:Secreted protein n=1 Tax=Schistosoma mansoni TaxID=6183 RepID=A0A5K4F5P1_SCHMA